MTKNQGTVLVGAGLLGCITLAAWGYSVGDWWAMGAGAAPVVGFLFAVVTAGAQRGKG